MSGYFLVWSRYYVWLYSWTYQNLRSIRVYKLKLILDSWKLRLESRDTDIEALMCAFVHVIDWLHPNTGIFSLSICNMWNNVTLLLFGRSLKYVNVFYFVLVIMHFICQFLIKLVHITLLMYINICDCFVWR